MANDESLGQKIKRHRQSRGETQEEFAHRLGICRATLSSWEKGDVPQPIGKLIEEIYAAENENANVYQLQLPFSEPIDLELRIAPKRAAGLRMDVEWKEKTR